MCVDQFLFSEASNDDTKQPGSDVVYWGNNLFAAGVGECYTLSSVFFRLTGDLPPYYI